MRWIPKVWVALALSETIFLSDDATATNATNDAGYGMNPATGLPMVGSVDIEGNPFGVGSISDVGIDSSFSMGSDIDNGISSGLDSDLSSGLGGSIDDPFNDPFRD